MNKTTNTGRSIVVLLFFSLTILFQTTAGATNSGLVTIEDEIKKVTDNILFEEGLDKKLTEAKTILLALNAANTGLGKSFLAALSVLSSNKVSSEEIAKEIAKVNKQLAPFFQLDANGNLLWGTALQFLAVQQQFLPTGVIALTPANASETLDGMQKQNLSQLAANKRELENLQARVEVVKKAQEKFQKQLQELTSQLNANMASIGNIQQAKKNFDEAKLQYSYVLARLQNAENMAQNGIAIMARLVTGKMFFSQFLKDFEKDKIDLKAQTEQLNKNPLSSLAMDEMETAKTICGYFNSTSSTPPPTAEKIAQWMQESENMISKAEGTRKVANEKIQTIRESLASLISALQGELQAMEEVDRQAYSKGLQELQRMKDTGKLNSVEQDGREIEKIVATMNLSLKVAPNLSLAISRIIKDTSALLQSLPEGDEDLSKKALQLKIQAKSALDELEAVKKENRLLAGQDQPETPEASSKLKDFAEALKDLDTFAAGPLFEKMDAALADGKKIISEANEALAKAPSSNSTELERAKNCSMSLQDIANQQAAKAKEKERAVSEAVIAQLQEIVDIGQDLLSSDSWSDDDFFANFAAAQKSCDAAGKFRDKMFNQAELVLKAELEVEKALGGAAAMADKCPDVNDPENIRKLYDYAQQLIGNINFERATLIEDNSKLVNEIVRARSTRNRALQQWVSARNFVLATSNKITLLWQEARSEAPETYEARSLWGQAGQTVKWANSITPTWRDITEVTLSERYPECTVAAADKMVSAVENAYTAALINFAAAENLPGRAAACKTVSSSISQEKDSDNDGITDDKDKCFATPAGAQVDANGCTVNPFADGVTRANQPLLEKLEKRSQDKAVQVANDKMSAPKSRSGFGEMEKSLDDVSKSPQKTPTTWPPEDPATPTETAPTEAATPETAVAPTTPPGSTAEPNNSPQASTAANDEDTSPEPRTDPKPPTPTKTANPSPAVKPAVKRATPPPAPVSPPKATPSTPSPETVLTGKYIGTWKFNGTRKDGKARSGNMEFAFNGAVAYTIIDQDSPQGYTGVGKWKVELRGNKVYLTLRGIKGKTWEGFASGSIKQFSLLKTVHGSYTFTRIR